MHGHGLELHLLHPMAVHFPIALLSAGLAAAVFEAWRGKPAWLAEAASWLLWLGTASAWAAVGLGRLAERTAEHVPLAWEMLAHHEELAYWTAGSFTVLSVWKAWQFYGRAKAGRAARVALLAGWAAAVGLLFYTAQHGGELVFTYGMGVASEEEEHDEHDSDEEGYDGHDHEGG